MVGRFRTETIEHVIAPAPAGINRAGAFFFYPA